jgi:hypothetical protein
VHPFFELLGPDSCHRIQSRGHGYERGLRQRGPRPLP